MSIIFYNLGPKFMKLYYFIHPKGFLLALKKFNQMKFDVFQRLVIFSVYTILKGAEQMKIEGTKSELYGGWGKTSHENYQFLYGGYRRLMSCVIIVKHYFFLLTNTCLFWVRAGFKLTSCSQYLLEFIVWFFGSNS